MTHPTHVYVGAGRYTGGSLSGLFRHTVGEEGWTQLTKGLPAPASIHAVTVSPDRADVVYVGTQDGPYRSTDRGERWERLGFPDRREVWSIQVHPHDARVLYAGTSPVGVYRSEDGGDTWRRLPNAVQPPHVKMAFECRVMRLAIDPTHPGEVYAGIEVGGVMRTLDDGETWADCTADLLRLAEQPHLRSRIQSDSDAEGMLDTHALCVSPAQPGTVFLAVRMGIFRSDDRGQTWHDVEVGRFSLLTYARDLRVAPHDPRMLYACLSPASRSEAGTLYRSLDLGGTWARVDHRVTALSTMMGVALHSRDADQVFCAARLGQVLGTLDGGRTWRAWQLPDGVQDVYAIACG